MPVSSLRAPLPPPPPAELESFGVGCCCCCCTNLGIFEQFGRSCPRSEFDRRRQRVSAHSRRGDDSSENARKMAEKHCYILSVPYAQSENEFALAYVLVTFCGHLSPFGVHCVHLRKYTFVVTHLQLQRRRRQQRRGRICPKD